MVISTGQLQALSCFLRIGMKDLLIAFSKDFWKIVAPLAVFDRSENEVSRLDEAREEEESTEGDGSC